MPRVLDFKALLDEHRIEYVTRGKNVSRGEVNIQCPFCGSADPSHHMGINLESGWWSCWRNANHRGKSPLRLLVALLRIPYWQARELAGLGKDYVDPDGFSSVVQRLRDGWGTTVQAEQAEARVLRLDRDFRPVDGTYATRRFEDYLCDVRGFDRRDVPDVCLDYDLHCATGGTWAGRLIMPYYMDGQLVTWTGRAIGRAEVRYKDLSVDESLLAPKHTLYNHDALIEGGRVLVIVEGPMDAMKLDFYGRPYGVRAVGLSTNSMQDDQAYLLAESCQQFDRLGVMMDRASAVSIADSMRMRNALSFLGRPVQSLLPPGGAKDAAAAHFRDLQHFAKELTT